MPSRRAPARGETDGSISLERVQSISVFRGALRRFLRQSDDVARVWDLTPQRYLLLLAIKGAPDGSQRLNFTDIAEQLQLSKNTTTELVARAEEAGLLYREPSTDDQRVVYLRLTPEGDRRLCGALIESDRYRDEFNAAFSRLAKMFRQAAKQAASADG